MSTHIYELCYMHSSDNGSVKLHDTFGSLQDARDAMKREINYMSSHRSTKPDKILSAKNGFTAIFLPKTIPAYTITYFIIRDDEKFYGQKLAY